MCARISGDRIVMARLVQDSGLLRLCGQHHRFHDPWRYDVKKRPITGKACMLRHQTSVVCNIECSIRLHRLPVAQKFGLLKEGNVISYERSGAVALTQSLWFIRTVYCFQYIGPVTPALSFQRRGDVGLLGPETGR
ncbi:hypothetical protein BO94DRAFT_82921 [Aspergillus sclerotioniger CBS 115572]|uniref:Uncharacterized protein n=1 Tax=Aspergillus sclerotioniger CBS 115572 TaxID=1450535 RepID=A0A317WJE9_9EURO|nr:hypothetical protein BO94DRAFT_82921 [Aspergillus sclerotioniger CBS 115572]PWY86449.1 hypothetical protein BO94DRAFT_82921 [Aspergillus sclerotioniger CBS 115572]